MEIKILFQRFKEVSNNFQTINSVILERNPEFLKIIRLSLKMPIMEFVKTFKMFQESRYERHLTKPSKSTLKRFVKIFEQYKHRCKFNLSFIENLNKKFLEKRKAGKFIGSKTLFKKNDKRTKELSYRGCKKGGLTTIAKYGTQYMAKLAKRIRRGRNENYGFRSQAEYLVAKILDELNIPYEYEKPLKGYLPDFCLNGNIILEVMCVKTQDYFNKQKIKIDRLSKNFKIIVITNKPNEFISNPNVKVIKFSKYFNIFKQRIAEVLDPFQNENPRIAIAVSQSSIPMIYLPLMVVRIFDKLTLIN